MKRLIVKGEIKEFTEEKAVDQFQNLVYKFSHSIVNNTQYYKAGIEPIYGKYDIFYRGVPYSPEEKYFSFVPCKTDYSQGQLPKIDLTSLSFTINKQFNSWRAIPINLTNSVWNTIINEVLKSGWELGIHIDKI